VNGGPPRGPEPPSRTRKRLYGDVRSIHTAPPLQAQALRRWQRAAGPYWMYVCAAPFLRAIPVGHRHHRRTPPAWDIVDAAVRLADSSLSRSRLEPPRGPLPNAGGGEERGTTCPATVASRLAIFVDLAPTATLPLAGELNRRGYIVVPIIQRWMAAPAVLPCEELARQLLVSSADVQPVPGPRGVVFLLDGDRVGTDAAAALPPGAFDNRYEYPVDRFPPVELLRAQGVVAVHWLSSIGIAPDLEPYAARLHSAGLLPLAA